MITRGRLIGLLFILATVAGVVSGLVAAPVLGAPDYLASLPEHVVAVRLAAFFEVVMAAAVVAIAVVLFPVLRPADETAAIGYLAVRIVEGVLLALGSVAMLALLPLGAAAAGNAQIAAVGDAINAFGLASFTLGAAVFFSVSAVILNVVFYRARMVPRLLSVWGVAGGGLFLCWGLLWLFDVADPRLEPFFTAPIALNEMALAVWLIVKGRFSA